MISCTICTYKLMLVGIFKLILYTAYINIYRVYLDCVLCSYLPMLLIYIRYDWLLFYFQDVIGFFFLL